MALFMPTNISPSTLGELGNGTVDVTEGLTVSWQVDGQNAMTAFRIRIMENTAQSKQLYDTGRVTDGCPFYGRDAKGDVVFFSYGILAGELSLAGIANGNSYKLLITQWWSASESVTQQSASVFLCRDRPSLEIDGGAKPGTFMTVDTTSKTFTATYQQAQGDPLMWVRWRLSRYDTSLVLLEDTGNVSTNVLQFQYNGFLNGERYLLQCDVETVNGVKAEAFSALQCTYDVAETAGVVQTCVDRRKSGVRLSWPNAAYIPGGVISGSYSITKQQLTLLEGAEIQWTGSTDWTTPFSVVWSGKVQSLPATVLNIYVPSGEVQGAIGFAAPMSVEVQTDRVSVLWKNVEIGYAAGTFLAEDQLTVVLTGGKIYVRRKYEQGMYPAETLVPTEKVFPKKSKYMTVTYTGDAELVGGPISELRLIGPQVCDYLWVLSGDVPDSVLTALMSSAGYTPGFDANTWFLADFTNGLNGGNIQTNERIGTWRVYRMDKTSKDFTFVAFVGEPIREILDCAAASKHTYVYYVLGENVDGEIVTQAMKSVPVEVCLWDWTLLACKDDTGGQYLALGKERGYQVTDIFRFSLNVESGTVGNNNTPELLENFTRYPTVQVTPQRYMSGTLSGYLGSVDADGAYSDSLAQRDALFALAQTDGTLFLKNRKGDLRRISISGQISCRTQDATRQQALICAVPWAETGSAEEVGIFIRKEDALWVM